MNTDIAVIGVSVEVPGARGLDDFWQIISSGTSLTKPFPQDRRRKLDDYIRYLRATSVDPVTDPDIDYHNGCFLDTVDSFDYAVFGMNPRQAALTDPHHRMVMRAMFLGLEDAGYSIDRLRGSRTGVFVGFAVNPGSTYLDYLCRVDPAVGQQAITGNIPTMLANRLSHFLDLRGPSMVVDTACSATLVAVHQAKNALLAGDCDLAVVGGARIVFAPVKHPHSNIGIESSDGVTRTFDESADGTGFGEGSGSVVLKRLDQAVVDGDQVYAVIKGSAVNHDGNTEGITNPDSDSQADLLISAWRNADVDPRSIGYLEAHGTATRVGDPIEHEGMRRAFARHTTDRNFCAVGTVKANVGHLFEGSGVIGLLKAIAVLRHRMIPPQANFENPNPKLDFASGPLYVSTSLQPWDSPDGPRRCGVSAFGLGGTNAHVVVQEYVAPAGEAPAGEGLFLFTLSAATPRSLTDLIDRYLGFIDAGGLADTNIADVCHTARASRSSHRHRVALAVGSAADLREQLAATLADGPLPVADGPLAAEAAAYLQGAAPTIERTDPGHRPRIVHLPGYVFDESTAWVEFPESWRSQLSLATIDESHPVTHDVELQATTAPEVPATAGSATILVLADPDTDGAALATAAVGADARVLRLGEPIPGTTVPFDARDPRSFEAIAALVSADDITHIVHTLAFEHTPATTINEIDRRAAKNLHSLFLLCKALMAAGVKVDLTVLTHRAVCAVEGDATTVTENAALVGFGKVIGREYPYIKVTHVDVDATVPAAAVRAEVLSHEYGLFVLRGTERLREVFVEVEPAPADGPATCIRPAGTYLITGGTGALGLAVARSFALQQSDVTLVLLSRSGMPPREQWDSLLAKPAGSPSAGRIRAVQELERLGATVLVTPADVGDPAALAEAVIEIQRKCGRIDGIVHAAGLPGGSTVMFRDLDDFDAVIRAKLHAAFMLEQLTRGDRPDFVVHFSSVASVFPAPGQADYAAANYYLDNLARARAGEACHTIALDWVAWKEIGMAVDHGTNGDTMFKALPTTVALDVLDTGLRSRRSRLFAGELHYRGELIHLLRSYDVTLSPSIEIKAEREMRALDERLLKASKKIKESVFAVEVDLDGRTDGEYSALEVTVAQCLALAFGFPTLNLEADFFDLGGDSIMAASVASNISVCHGVPYDVADLLADRTIAEIAYHIEDLADLAANAA